MNERLLCENEQNISRLTFLAVQDSSIGDLVTHSVSESVMFCFSDFREHCRAVIDTCGFSDRETFERLQ